MALKVVPWLQPLIDELWKNKSGYLKNPQNYTFDYPDCGGISEDLFTKLKSDHLDIISRYIDSWYQNCNTKAQFTRALIEELSNGLITT